MKASKFNANTLYYLALLDWREAILSPADMNKFTRDVISSPLPPIDGWITCSLHWPDLEDEVIDIIIGYYHSRLIFRFRLVSVPKNIFGIRRLRIKLEKRVRKFLVDKVIPAMKPYVKKPRIFIYPIFELRSKENFWKFDKQKPYSLPTTCFYAELDDPKGRKFEWLVGSLRPKKVKMRVSGAKIITSEMSNWFFWNLINIVFHEGLYRQSREDDRFRGEKAYPGLENRLEDFASSLMTMFYELSSARVQDLIAKFVLVLTIVGILIAFIQFVLPLFSQLFRPSAPDPLNIQILFGS